MEVIKWLVVYLELFVNGKIAKLANEFNKMDSKELANGMNYFRKINEKVEDQER